MIFKLFNTLGTIKNKNILKTTINARSLRVNWNFKFTLGKIMLYFLLIESMQVIEIITKLNNKETGI